MPQYLNNKRCPNVVYEAMEAMGGMGDVEDTTLPMLFRESPLNSIWEGSGNVICLDVLRTFAHEPLAGEALNAELDAARGSDERFDMALGEARVRWRKSPEENEARVFVEAMATL